MDFEKSSIERLKRTLYSRDENAVPKEKHTPVQTTETDVPTSWGRPPVFDLTPDNTMTKKNNSFFNKFLGISLLFFVLSLGIAAFIFFGGFRTISSSNVDIKVTAPSSVSSGEELLTDISIVNSNPTDMQDVKLFIDYPEGAQSVEQNKVIVHDTISLGIIGKGQSKNQTLRTLLFGEKDVIKTFSLRLEYKVIGSNATFSKEKTFEVSLGSSPILLDVLYPQEVNSGQPVTLSIDVTSNSSVVMRNTLVKIEYPYGFTYTTSSSKPLRDNSIWNLGDLKNGDKKTLRVTGVLVGQNLEDRSFRISSGVQSGDNSRDFDTDLAVSTITLGIRKSFFDLAVTPAQNGVLAVGQALPVTIKWQNTLPDKIVNSHIEATLSGNALDRSRVSANSGGFYRSVDNTVLWDKNTTGILADMTPGDSGQIVLTLASIANSTQMNSLRNPHIDVHVVITGERSGTESGTVTSQGDVTIKIPSTLTISAKSSRNVGPFSNTGPVPPRADVESTYTATWTLTNTTNDLKDTVVSATLPVGVTWKGETSPSGEKITYNPDTRTVSWNVGNISAGTGFTNSPKTASFKVGITPSVLQVDTVPNIISQTSVTATDTYTATPIQLEFPPLTTQFSDSGNTTGNGTVVK